MTRNGLHDHDIAGGVLTIYANCYEEGEEAFGKLSLLCHAGIVSYSSTPSLPTSARSRLSRRNWTSFMSILWSR